MDNPEYVYVLDTIEGGQVVDYSAEEAMVRFPDVVAHIVAESLGSVMPTQAAHILSDALTGHLNHCEWIDTCFSYCPRPAVKQAIENREHHLVRWF